MRIEYDDSNQVFKIKNLKYFRDCSYSDIDNDQIKSLLTKKIPVEHVYYYHFIRLDKRFFVESGIKFDSTNDEYFVDCIFLNLAIRT